MLCGFLGCLCLLVAVVWGWAGVTHLSEADAVLYVVVGWLPVVGLAGAAVLLFAISLGGILALRYDLRRSDRIRLGETSEF